MSNELIITPIPLTLVEFMWPKCAPVLNRAIKMAEQDLTLTTTKTALLSGKQTLMTVLENDKVIAAGLLEITEFDTGMKALLISVLAGDRIKEWQDRFLTIIHGMAANEGCDEIRSLSMRKGWEKFLKPHGWTNHITVMRCAVKQSDVIDIKQRVKS